MFGTLFIEQLLICLWSKSATKCLPYHICFRTYDQPTNVHLVHWAKCTHSRRPMTSILFANGLNYAHDKDQKSNLFNPTLYWSNIYHILLTSISNHF